MQATEAEQQQQQPPIHCLAALPDDIFHLLCTRIWMNGGRALGNLAKADRWTRQACRTFLLAGPVRRIHRTRMGIRYCMRNGAIKCGSPTVYTLHRPDMVITCFLGLLSREVSITGTPLDGGSSWSYVDARSQHEPQGNRLKILTKDLAIDIRADHQFTITYRGAKIDIHAGLDRLPTVAHLAIKGAFVGLPDFSGKDRTSIALRTQMHGIYRLVNKYYPQPQARQQYWANIEEAIARDTSLLDQIEAQERRRKQQQALLACTLHDGNGLDFSFRASPPRALVYQAKLGDCNNTRKRARSPEPGHPPHHHLVTSVGSSPSCSGQPDRPADEKASGQTHPAADSSKPSAKRRLARPRKRDINGELELKPNAQP
jgi:hypothetical protein